MPAAPAIAAPLILPPIFGYADASGAPRRPTVGESLAEWVDAINPIRDPTRAVPLVAAVHHVVTGLACLWFFTAYLTWDSLPLRVFSTGAVLWMSLVYNSLWWHRYCTHRSYTFRSLFWARLLAWTNPLVYRDESFIIAHRIHHRHADRVGDPYAPHLGWLGCYLAIESTQRYNRHISRDQFDAVCRGLRHTGLRLNSYDAFLRTGSFEHVGSYLAHAIGAQVLWATPVYWIGGVDYLVAWFASIFINVALLRNFNYVAHLGEVSRPKRPGWEFGAGQSRNLRFYGFVAGEWHNNHHEFPGSARQDFLRGQPDIGFVVIRLLTALGIVGSYRDQRAAFRRTHGLDRVKESRAPEASSREAALPPVSQPPRHSTPATPLARR